MDVMKKEMQRVDVTKEDGRIRVRWKQMIHCGDA